MNDVPDEPNTSPLGTAGDGFQTRIFVSRREAAEFAERHKGHWQYNINQLSKSFETVANSSHIFRLLKAIEVAFVRIHREDISRIATILPEKVMLTSPFPFIENDNLLTADIWRNVAIVLRSCAFLPAMEGVLEGHKDLFVSVITDPRVITGLVSDQLKNVEYERRLLLDLQGAKESFKRITGEIRDKVAEYEATIHQARETIVFKNAKDLWSNKAAAHEASYTWGFLVLLVSVMTACFVAVGIGSSVKDHLPRNAAGEFTYLASFVVVAGFITVAWIVRMIGRFVVENFSLASDARQRQVILETFLNLVGTPEAKMVEGERVLILNALFRPAVGQSSDDAAPATLLDLMKSATDKAPSK